MTSRNPLAAITGFFGALGSAVAVSEAVRNRRTPNDSDLRRLGVDPKQFALIRRF